MFLTYSNTPREVASNLTVVILTKNEELNIASAINNAQYVTDNVLVVDSGSTDKTVEIAKANGAKVIYREWDNDFAAQRNFALEYVDTEWVLYLDADERMEWELGREIVKVVKDNQDKQYIIKRKSIAFGKEFNHGVLRPDYVARLFKTKNVLWINKVHEKPVCKDKLQNLNSYIKHYTYTDWEQYFRKFNQYTSVWAENAYQNKKKVTYLSAFGHAVVGFFQMAILKCGIFDGYLGLVLAFNHFGYTLMKYVKLIELYRRGK